MDAFRLQIFLVEENKDFPWKIESISIIELRSERRKQNKKECEKSSSRESIPEYLYKGEGERVAHQLLFYLFIYYLISSFSLLMGH